MLLSQHANNQDLNRITVIIAIPFGEMLDVFCRQFFLPCVPFI